MRGDNLRFYVERKTFEDISYPDRPLILKAFSLDWCNTASPAFLPSVYMYDIKTGDKLDSYNCVFEKIKTG